MKEVIVLFMIQFKLKPVFGRGPVAQWLEQSAHNRLVVGSIPTRPTIVIMLKRPNGSFLI